MSLAAELQQSHKARLERIAMAAERHLASKQLALLEPPKPEPAPEPEPVEDGWVEPQHKPLWFSVISATKLTPTGLPTIRSIQIATCDVYGVKLNCLLSARRTANLARPRQVSMYLARELTRMSLPKIGMATGDRDHTTVLHAIRKIEHLVKSDRGLAERIAEIKRRLT